jgi:hypothetical protein
MVETRIATRYRVSKAATIEFVGGNIDCTIRDLSITGAALELPSQIDTPAKFTLVVPRGWSTSALPCCLAQRISDGSGFRLGRLSWRPLSLAIAPGCLAGVPHVALHPTR